MRAGRFRAWVPIKREHLNTLRKRENLPSRVPAVEGAAGPVGWHEYSGQDAFELRLQLELMGSVHEWEAGSGALPSFASKAVPNALSKSLIGRSIDAFRSCAEDAYVGFALVEEINSAGETQRYFAWFCGPMGGLESWREALVAKALDDGWASRVEFVRLGLVNASAVARGLHERAAALGVLEEVSDPDASPSGRNG